MATREEIMQIIMERTTQLFDGTLSDANLSGADLRDANWKCKIPVEHQADIVVPYGTDGKIRCSTVVLMEVVE